MASRAIFQIAFGGKVHGETVFLLPRMTQKGDDHMRHSMLLAVGLLSWPVLACLGLSESVLGQTSPPLTGDNFYNGYRAPPQTVSPTGIPLAGSGLNEIPSVLSENADFATFDSGVVSGPNPPLSGPLNLVITTTNPTSLSIAGDVRYVQILIDYTSPIMGGVAFNCTAKYARTWWNRGPAQGSQTEPPHRYQVWRFVIQGESDWTQLLPNYQLGAERPDCYSTFYPGSFQPIYQGFIDYIQISTDGSLTPASCDWHVRLSLTHHAGCISHINFPNVNAGAIATGSSKHAVRSYNIVAPSTGWHWLGGNTNDIATRLSTAGALGPGFTGELRAHDDILDTFFPGSAPFNCLTEEAFYWEDYVHNLNDDCGGSFQLPSAIYFCQEFSLPPSQPNAYSWCFQANLPGNPVWYENLGLLVSNPFLPGMQAAYGLFAWPFFRMELGHWDSLSTPAFEWVDEVSLFACGGAFYLQDSYNRGATGPYPDPQPTAMAHDPLQLIWGVTTDHENQPLYNQPHFELDGVMVEPTLQTDFANQLEGLDYYNGFVPPLPAPDPPLVWFGDPWAVSSLVWQIAED